jgi:hypothetical protein
VVDRGRTDLVKIVELEKIRRVCRSKLQMVREAGCPGNL